jgi:hypothetical protein
MITLLYLGFFLPMILKTNFLLLGLAFFFFVLSVGIDIFDPFTGDIAYLIEDTPKFIGILTWLAYNGFDRDRPRGECFCRATEDQNE